MPEIDAGALKSSVHNAIERHLEGRDYDDGLVGSWSKSIRADIVDEVQAYKLKNAKIIVHVTLLQQGGAGMHVASSTLWDPDNDVSVTAVWESEKIYCNAAVFILRF